MAFLIAGWHQWARALLFDIKIKCIHSRTDKCSWCRCGICSAPPCHPWELFLPVEPAQGLDMAIRVLAACKPAVVGLRAFQVRSPFIAAGRQVATLWQSPSSSQSPSHSPSWLDGEGMTLWTPYPNRLAHRAPAPRCPQLSVQGLQWAPPASPGSGHTALPQPPSSRSAPGVGPAPRVPAWGTRRPPRGAERARRTAVPRAARPGAAQPRTAPGRPAERRAAPIQTGPQPSHPSAIRLLPPRRRAGGRAAGTSSLAEPGRVGPNPMAAAPECLRAVGLQFLARSLRVLPALLAPAVLLGLLLGAAAAALLCRCALLRPRRRREVRGSQAGGGFRPGYTDIK